MSVYTYDFQGLVNEVLDEMGEVPLSTTTDFDNATNFHKKAKEAVNNAMLEIGTKEDGRWSFLNQEYSIVCTIGDNIYTPDTTINNIQWDSFYIDKVYGDENNFTSVTADAATKTYTIAGGSFITKGFAVGMKVTWADLNIADNNQEVTINTLTATAMTVDETVTDMTTPDTDFTVQNADDAPDGYDIDQLEWSNYRERFFMDDVNSNESSDYGLPVYDIESLDQDIIISPKPDQTYLIKYRAWQKMSSNLLTNTTDVPIIPQEWKNIILEGALKRLYRFEEDLENMAVAEDKFDRAINDMRRSLIPQPDSVWADI